MTREQYLTRVAAAEVCGPVENLPAGWAPQLRAALREAQHQPEPEPEAEL
jgi:hypothetical protein